MFPDGVDDWLVVMDLFTPIRAYRGLDLIGGEGLFVGAFCVEGRGLQVQRFTEFGPLDSRAVMLDEDRFLETRRR